MKKTTYNEFIQNIIDTRGQWNIPEGEYYEAHHIVPKCLGGLPKNNSKKLKHENLIWLYPEEHYEAHKLLALENLSNNSLVFAWHRIHVVGNTKITSTEYKILREALARSSSELNKGRKISEETRSKLSMKSAGKNNPMYGKPCTEERRRKIGLANKGRKWDRPGTWKGKQQPESLINKRVEKNKKKVKDLNTGKIYDSIKSAAADLNISSCHLSVLINENKLCHGHRIIKIQGEITSD